MNETDNFAETVQFRLERDRAKMVRDVLLQVFLALQEKGYDPINQMVGYIMSGDPTYITTQNNARGLIRKLERDEILEEMLRFYIDKQLHDR